MSFSDIAIAIKVADYEKMQKAIMELDEERKKSVTRLMQGASVESSIAHQGYIILQWKWVKWKANYPEVKFLRSFLESIKKYDYIRIGIEYDDVEYEFNTGENIISIERKISCS